jgi:hypothetical protein
MVNKEVILDLVHRNYYVRRGYVVVNDDGVVDVLQLPGASQPVVQLHTYLKDGVMPVSFGRVEGDFDVSSKNVKTLKGFPKYIKGILYTEHNQHLRQFYDFAIEKVEGIWYSDYKEHQHLLKMLVANKIQLENSPIPVTDILNAHAGQGKPGMIKAAAALVKLGYKDNAKW